MTFILREPPYGGRGVIHYTSDEIKVRRIEKTRVVRQLAFGQEVEGTGQYFTDKVRVMAAGVPNGLGHKGRIEKYVQLTAAGVKEVVRRLRPQEAEAIAQQDQVIRGLESQLLAAREVRKALVRDAWTKAHTVTLKEIQEAAQ